MVERRINICKNCPELRPLVHQCKQCGCVMPVKVWFSGMKCPIDKWGREDEQG